MATAATQADATRAKNQVEFYFSDSNLPFDKYLWTLYSQRSDHYIPIKIISSFKRMRDFQKFGAEWLVKVLRESSNLEVDDKGENVRRTTEPKEETLVDAEGRTVYAKNFGEEVPGLQEKLEDFFAQWGHVNAVRMRRDADKKFKSSVFCEYGTMDGVKAFLQAEPEWNGEKLLIMSKADYIKMKCNEKGITPGTKTKNKSQTPAYKFNAFSEMRKNGGKTGNTVLERDWTTFGRTLKVQRIPGEPPSWKLADGQEETFLRNYILKFTSSGNVGLKRLKNAAKDSVGDLPFVINEEGSHTGYLCFQRALTEEDLEKLQKSAAQVEDISYSYEFIADEAEEKKIQNDHITSTLARAEETGFFADKDKKGKKPAGRGGNKASGRSNGAPGNVKKAAPAAPVTNVAASKPNTSETMELDAEKKRKRDAFEPEGAVGAGERGNTGVPVIGTASKRVKTD